MHNLTRDVEVDDWKMHVKFNASTLKYAYRSQKFGLAGGQSIQERSVAA